MRVLSFIVVSAALMAVIIPGHAQAPRVLQARQNFLPPYEILNIVRSMRLRPITRPQWQGRNYVVRAIDMRGEERRILIDARFGKVVEAVPVVRAGGYPADHAYRARAMASPDIGMAPPRVIPAPRSAALAPQTTPQSTSNNAPLPRARPHAETNAANVASVPAILPVAPTPSTPDAPVTHAAAPTTGKKAPETNATVPVQSFE